VTDFDEQGFMVLRRLLSPEQVSSYRQVIDELTGEGGDLNYWEGVTREARFWPLIFEPGLLARLRELTVLGRPIVIGTSRKRFIGQITGESEASDRSWGTAATVAWSIANGASIVRVHDVAAMVKVVKMCRAIIRET